MSHDSTLEDTLQNPSRRLTFLRRQVLEVAYALPERYLETQTLPKFFLRFIYLC